MPAKRLTAAFRQPPMFWGPADKHADIPDRAARRVTWAELFFDLVFVAAVGQLANALFVEPTVARFFEFMGLFVPVWWAWWVRLTWLVAAGLIAA